MELNVLVKNSYKVVIEKNSISKISSYYATSGKILVLRDENVDKKYFDLIKKQYSEVNEYVVQGSENSKTITTYEQIISYLLKNNYSRSDTLIALGGGVIGDLGGFVSSSYKRGMNFIIVPTTTLSMVDSSVGGKVAINYEHYKNVIGAFYQPKLVIIDINVLETLDKRNYYNGLVEALKMGLIANEKLYSLFKGSINDSLEEIICLSLQEKIKIVENDEFENNIRKLLNFGHTIGHAIESSNYAKVLHGEAVALGMLYFLSENIKDEVVEILKKMHIPLTNSFNKEEAIKYLKNDKKIINDKIVIVRVDEIGKGYLQEVNLLDIQKLIER